MHTPQDQQNMHVYFYDLYVNDILLANSDLGVIPNKDMLFENFEMKDSGKVSYVLLIKIYEINL